MKCIAAIVFLILCGCASPQSPDEVEAARRVVLSHLGADAKIAGPISKKAMKDLAMLAQKERSQALALLESGANCFFVFGPDFNTVLHTKNGPMMDFIKIDRVVFISHGRVVGDFPVNKPETNHPSQPTATPR